MRGALRLIGGTVLGLFLLALVVGAAYLLAIAAGWASLPLANIQRQVTQQSLAYVQAHQEQLMSYWSDYQTGDDAHKAAARTLICTEAPLLAKDQWPGQIALFVATNCQQ